MNRIRSFYLWLQKWEEKCITSVCITRRSKSVCRNNDSDRNSMNKEREPDKRNRKNHDILKENQTWWNTKLDSPSFYLWSIIGEQYFFGCAVSEIISIVFKMISMIVLFLITSFQLLTVNILYTLLGSKIYNAMVRKARKNGLSKF